MGKKAQTNGGRGWLVAGGLAVVIGLAGLYAATSVGGTVPPARGFSHLHGLAVDTQ